jgi:NAD(P)H-dependent FMN reductase
VARFIAERMRRSERIATEVLDLLGYPFPVLAERLRFRDNPPPGLPEFSEKVARSDALVIVTPAYHNGYPGALKHALDYLLPEYQRKPITIVTVSAGGFGGRNCLAQLRLVTLGMGACPIPAALPVSRVQDSVGEHRNPTDASYEKQAQSFIAEVLWFTEAIAVQKAKDKY